VSDNYKQEIIKSANSIRDMLVEKNKRYGSSVFDHSVNVFDKIIESDKESIEVKGILIRILDKLKRIQNSEELRKNDIADIIGYLLLISVHKQWNDFSDLLD